MRTLVPYAGFLLLSGAPAAAVADGGSVAVGARTRPLSWSSKAPSSATPGSANRRRTTATGSGDGSPAPGESTGDGNGSGGRHRPGRRQLPSSSSSGELASTLRGGWLGVDLIQEIAKAYLAPPSTAPGGTGDAAAAAAASTAAGSRAAGQKGPGAGSGTGAAAAEATTSGAASAKASSERGGGSSHGGRGDAGATTTGAAAAGRRAGDRKNAAGPRASRGSLGGGKGDGGGRRGDGSRGKDGRGGSVGRGESGSGKSGGVQGKMGRLRSALQHQVGGSGGRDRRADTGGGGGNGRLDTASSTTGTTNVPTDSAGGSDGGYDAGGVNKNSGSTLSPSSAAGAADQPRPFSSSYTNSEGFSNEEGGGGSGGGGANNPGTAGGIDAGRNVGGNGGGGGAGYGYGDNGFANPNYNDNKQGFNNQREASSHAFGGASGGGGGGGGGGGEGDEDQPGWEDRSRAARGAGREEAGAAGPGGKEETGDGEVEEQGGDASAANEEASERADERERDFWAELEEEELRAAAAAARTRDEIALLREIEGRSEHQGEVVGVIPPLGQHTRSVVTQAMPVRFVDEVGAHIATALAIAAARGLIHVVMNLRRQKKPEKVSFKDILGCDEAKQEVKQIVDFLVDPSAYDSIGASRPKGILLVGPPGTGKTLIAKACAGEAGVPFLYACGSDFNGVYVGMGVAAVKRLFAKARKHKKSIIYIDEIDYLGRSRNSGSRDASGATQDREATLNQLLSEMDGFEGKDGIVVMASTNRKEILDDALLRSGRFDMQVDVERPDRKGRAQLFSKYIAPLKLSDEDQHEEDAKKTETTPPGVIGGRRRSYYESTTAAAMKKEKDKQAAIKKQELREDIARELADMTPYMTGADVANVCATAGRIAARAGSDAVELEHFSAAVDRVQHGLEKPDKEVPQEDKERTAIHEAGHAVAAWMLPWCDEVVKVSIVWRGNALGFSQTAMVERQSQMREMVLDNVCMTLAGRAAEEVVCGTISGGASSDLRVASRQLYSAITEVGFGSSTGLLSPGNRPLSESVMAKIDEEVQNLLAQQYQRALALIRTHREKVDGLSGALLERNVVHKADLQGILGEKVTVESEEAAAEAALAAALGDTDDARSTADEDGKSGVDRRVHSGVAYGWAWPTAR